MRKITSSFALMGAITLAGLAPVASQAGTIFVPRDTVVPVVVENNMSINRVRVGDRFTAHVDNDRDLPEHTRLIGRVRRIQQDRDEQKGFVDLEFTDIILPDGSRHSLHATPVSLDSRYTERRADGRIVVKEDARKKEQLVLGGAVGGFILGSIIHKQAETTILGTLAGIIAAETDKKNDGYTILSKGQKIGMLVDQDVEFETYYDRRDNRWNNSRTGDRRDDDRRGDDRDRDGRNDDQRLGTILRNDPARDDNRSGDRIDDRSAPVISFEGRTLRFDDKAQPYRDAGTVMVPLEQAVKLLDLKMEKGRTSGIYVDSEDASLRLEQGSDQARLNGRSVDLARPVTDRDGVTYVSVEIFASLKKGNLSVDGNRIQPKTY